MDEYDAERSALDERSCKKKGKAEKQGFPPVNGRGALRRMIGQGWRRARTAPQHPLDPSELDVIVIGISIFLAFSTLRWALSGCNRASANE